MKAPFSVICVEALSEGSVLIPNFLFISLIYPHYGQYHFLLPFVLLYSFQKAGAFAIRGFGSIRHPKQYLLYGLQLSILGTILCVAGMWVPYLWDVGATLIGLGLSNYTALYRTLKDGGTKDHNWPLADAGIWSSLTAILILMALGFNNYVYHGHPVVPFTLFWLFQIFVYRTLSRGLAQYEESPLRIPWSHLKFDDFLPTLIILAITGGVRMLEQTAQLRFIVPAAIAFCALIAANFWTHKHSFPRHGFFALWYGFVQNFVIIFHVIYFIVMGDYMKVPLTFVLFMSSMTIGMRVFQYLKTRWNAVRLNRTSCAICFLGLGLFFNPHTELLGIFVAGMGAILGNAISMQFFLHDETIPPLERRIVQSQYKNLGVVLQQLNLLAVIAILSWILYDNWTIVLDAYTFHEYQTTLQSIFFYTKAICVGLMALIAIVLFRKPYSLQGTPQEAPPIP